MKHLVHTRGLATLAIVCAITPSTFAEPAKLRTVIDAELREAWKAGSITPAPRSTDSEFVRRVYLDLHGVIPSHDEAKSFLDDSDPDKRTKLIDRLLASPRYAVHQATTWDLVMFGRQPGEEVRRREAFQTWLTKQFESTPIDEIARQILLGDVEAAATYHARFRNRPEDATVEIARVFLGTQMQCARCHDHPFDKWTQKDFYGVAGFFVRLVVNDAGNANARKFTISEKAMGEVLFSGAAKDQKPGQKGEPVRPRFLGSDKDLNEPPLPKDYKAPPKANGPLPKPPFSRKEKFAAWATTADNPFFAKAIANRVWGQFMGRGLAHPVDDLGEHNPPSMPKLLDALVDHFKSSKFDLKSLIREIVNSEAYQLTGVGGGKEALPKKFERARVRPLTAEELLVSLKVASGMQPDDKLQNVTTEYFFRYFGEPTNGIGDFQGGLGEHLFLNNSGDIRNILGRRKGSLAETVLTSMEPWENRVERMFLAVLSRRPSELERKRFVEHCTSVKGNKVDGLVDEALWTLVNTAEFRFNK